MDANQDMERVTARVDDLMCAVFKRSGHAFARDDPLMPFAMFMGLLADDLGKRQHDGLEKFGEALGGVVADWDAAARETASEILNRALAAAKNEMAGLMQEGGKHAADLVSARLRQDLARLEAAKSDLSHAARVILLASGAGLIGGVLAMASALLLLWRLS